MVSAPLAGIVFVVVGQFTCRLTDSLATCGSDHLWDAPVDRAALALTVNHHNNVPLRNTNTIFILQEPSGSPTPKRPRGRPKGSKNKTAGKGKVSDVHPDGRAAAASAVPSLVPRFPFRNLQFLFSTVANLILLKGCPVVSRDILVGSV